MDGVIADFFNHFFYVMGFDINKIKIDKPWPYDIFSWLEGITGREYSPEDVWGVCNEEQHNFWKNIPAYNWTQALYDLCKSKVIDDRHLLICTYAQPHHECHKQKYQWLMKHINDIHPDSVIMGKQKHLFAKPNRILIDDCEANCDEFEANGGKIILFPQNWNKLHYVEDKLSYVTGRLDRIIAEIKEEI